MRPNCCVGIRAVYAMASQSACIVCGVVANHCLQSSDFLTHLLDSAVFFHMRCLNITFP